MNVDEEDPTASLPEVVADGHHEQSSAKSNLCQLSSWFMQLNDYAPHRS